MSLFKVGDIWTAPKGEWIVITTNSYIKKDGKLAMGKGVAKEALNKYPMIDQILGEYINETCKHLGFYGIAIITRYNLIALQTKYYFNEISSIELINKSISKLKRIMPESGKINMVFPGIGYGQLSPEKVYKECLKDLADNYIIWSTSKTILGEF